MDNARASELNCSVSTISVVGDALQHGKQKTAVSTAQVGIRLGGFLLYIPLPHVCWGAVRRLRGACTHAFETDSTALS